MFIFIYSTWHEYSGNSWPYGQNTDSRTSSSTLGHFIVIVRNFSADVLTRIDGDNQVKQKRNVNLMREILQ